MACTTRQKFASHDRLDISQAITGVKTLSKPASSSRKSRPSPASRVALFSVLDEGAPSVYDILLGKRHVSVKAVSNPPPFQRDLGSMLSLCADVPVPNFWTPSLLTVHYCPSRQWSAPRFCQRQWWPSQSGANASRFVCSGPLSLQCLCRPAWSGQPSRHPSLC